MAVVKVSDNKESLPPVVKINGKTYRVKQEVVMEHSLLTLSNATATRLTPICMSVFNNNLR